jgi:hypothetical protein
MEGHGKLLHVHGTKENSYELKWRGMKRGMALSPIQSIHIRHIPEAAADLIASLHARASAHDMGSTARVCEVPAPDPLI